MNWEARYIPPDPNPWHGRDDSPEGSCFFQRIKLVNLLSAKLERSHKTSFALIGFKCDEGTQRDLGRAGAVEGALAIRQRLARLPIQKSLVQIMDVGNIICTDHDLESSQAALGIIVKQLLEHRIHPIILGGGHELAYGHFQGVAACHPPEKRLGIINFDAHFNLHPLDSLQRSSTTTTFTQIAKAHQTENRRFDYNCIGIQAIANTKKIFAKAKSLNTRFLLAEDIHQGLIEKSFDFVDRVIDENEFILMSIALDVLSPAFAPGVGSIQPLGLSPWQIIPLIRQAAASGKVISYDIAELVPRYDIDHRTAKLAASLVYEIVHHHNAPHHSL